MQQPNTSIPTENPQSSLQVAAVYSQTNPEHTNGQAQSRGGEANKVAEIDTGLVLEGPYDPHCLWLPEGWFDWSGFCLWGILMVAKKPTQLGLLED